MRNSARLICALVLLASSILFVHKYHERIITLHRHIGSKILEFSNYAYDSTANASQRCEPALRTRSKEINVLEAVTCGGFRERVRQFSHLLDKIRETILSERGSRAWNGNTAGGKAEVVWGADDDFINQLQKYPQVLTVVLPWTGTRSANWSSLTDGSNLLEEEYYEWTASDPLCAWIEKPGTIKMKYDVTFNRTCNRDTNKTALSRSLNPLFLNMKPINVEQYWPNNGLSFPNQFYTEPPPFVFYLQILQDAVVYGEGDVYAGNLKFVPYGCQPSRDTQIPSGNHSRPLYDELFVIRHYWGASVFHRMLEIAPRLGGSLEFLRSHPRIKIYCPEGPGGRLGELFRILGLREDRMVIEWGRANIVYVPRASMCGMPNVQETQLISSLYRQYVVDHLQPMTRTKLVLIHRSHQRRFTEQSAIEKILRETAAEFRLEFELFGDNPTPSLNDTMRLFHAAVMVVAPHGAGLSNVIFSRPGTYVIEGVCNLPHVNLCFLRTAVILGQHWHGIPSRGGCEDVVNVAANDIGSVARVYLEQWRSNLNRKLRI